MTFFQEGLGIFCGAGLRFFQVGLGIFRVGLGIIREAGMTFFSGGVAIFWGGVEIFSGGVEIFSEGLRLYPGGVEIFFGEGGGGGYKILRKLRNVQGVCEVFRGVKKYSGGVENYLVALTNFQGGCM